MASAQWAVRADLVHRQDPHPGAGGHSWPGHSHLDPRGDRLL